MDKTVFSSRKVLAVGAYCSPQPATVFEGKSYPSKITDSQYRLLAELGVNIVYGHNEVMGTDTQADAFEALKLCQKYGISYLVKDAISHRYTSLGHKGLPAFSALSQSQKEQLDIEFQKSLKAYSNHAAFAGISFIDEPGSDSFEGIARAKKVFERVCPGKIFYVNMFPYYITPEQYQYGSEKGNFIGKATDSGYDVGPRNIERYKYFYKKYQDIVNPQIFSYDAYPFVSLGGVQTAVHEVLYEMSQLGLSIKREYGIPYWTFMQAGGKWEEDLTVRVPDLGEVMLQVSVALAFGADGIQLFPYAYPNDWLMDNDAVAGVVDRHGKITPLYTYFKRALQQAHAVAPYLLPAKLQDMQLSGDYFGLLPSAQDFAKIKWSETIYKGTLPAEGSIEQSFVEGIESFECSSQCIISRFVLDDKNLYYLINNSAFCAASVNLKLKSAKEVKTVRDGKTGSSSPDINVVLAAGEGMLLVP